MIGERYRDREWHKAALRYLEQGLPRKDIALRMKTEFGLSNAETKVRCYLRRKSDEYQSRKKIAGHIQYLTHKSVPEVELGMKVRFDPLYGCVVGGHEITTGKVIDIHKDHSWFGVEYKLGDTKQRTSFNFCDIGKTVHICKGAHA